MNAFGIVSAHFSWLQGLEVGIPQNSPLSTSPTSSYSLVFWGSTHKKVNDKEAITSKEEKRIRSGATRTEFYSPSNLCLKVLYSGASHYVILVLSFPIYKNDGRTPESWNLYQTPQVL